MPAKLGWTIALVAVSAGWVNVAAGTDPALERAAAALRVNDLKSVRYAGDGIGWTFGQAYKPGEPWPKIKLNSWARTINYETGAMRDEIVLTRAEAATRTRPRSATNSTCTVNPRGTRRRVARWRVRASSSTASTRSGSRPMGS